MVANIAFVANCELHNVLCPYDDPALLERHGEQLLDLVVCLSSKEQWNTCLDLSMNVAASTGKRDILFGLFAARDGDSMDDRTLWRLLSIAAEEGKAELVSALIDAGAGPLVRAVDEVTWPITALHVAAKAGHRTFVTKLIEAGAPLELHHILGGTALTEAVEGGHKGVALERLTAGADVNNINDSRLPSSRGVACMYGDLTPLGIAVARNDKDMVKVLLEAGADPAAGSTYQLPLHMAASRGFFDIANSLLLAGASVDSVDTEGRTALHDACSNSRHGIVELLLRHNFSVASLCNNGISPMDAVGVQALALRQQGPPPEREINGLTLSYPSTLNSAETSTVDQICDMLQSASAWGRRGWLVVMRSRPLAEVVEQPTRSDADGGSLSVRDVHLVHEPSSNTAGVIREEGAVAQTSIDHGKASCDWSAAVVWLLQGPDEILFRNIGRFL